MLNTSLDFTNNQPAKIHILLIEHTGYYDRNGNEITQAAFYALKAAAMVQTVGRYAAKQYALRMGSTLALFRLAQQLQAMDKINLTRPS